MTLKSKPGTFKGILRIQLINKLISVFIHPKSNNTYNLWIINHKYKIKQIERKSSKLFKISEISWRIKGLQRDNFKPKKKTFSRKLGKLLNKIVNYNKILRKSQQNSSRCSYNGRRNNSASINRPLTSATKIIAHQKRIE